MIGDNLKISLLMLYNKVKETGILPKFMRLANISVIYKGKGEVSDLDSDRGIFLVSTFRTILMTMIYQDKYDTIEESMSDSNIGARKGKNIRNHIFIVNSIIHDVLSKKTNDPIDIMILDYKQMFDSECLFECMNDLFEAGVVDDKFSLLYEANRENWVAVKTPNGLTRREKFYEIVMQGDVLSPLISSLQVDTFGKECLEKGKHLYYYKNKIPIPPLGLVDDLFTISTCGVNTTKMNNFINNKTAMKRLQFGTTKCIKLHVGRTCSEAICKDLFVDGWKVETAADPESGNCIRKESYAGLEKMKVKTEHTYLGDIVSADGSHTKNILARKNKGQGVINQITSILESVFFGKYHFEVALILRSSLMLSSLLLNSEAWVNISEKDIRSLEQTDEWLLSRILDCDSNTSNAFKYLELGIYPIRFEIMKRKILFLQYILQQETNSMVFQVFKATLENPIKKDFVKVCEKYLEDLQINLTFDEISKMSKFSFSKLVKQKTEEAGFRYLLGEKSKQSKIMDIEYKSLKIQDYLLDGNKNIELSKLIFKARGQTLDIKTQKKWRYSDNVCTGCDLKVETIEEILACSGLIKNDEVEEIGRDESFFSDNFKDIVMMAIRLKKRLKVRQQIIDDKG